MFDLKSPLGHRALLFNLPPFERQVEEGPRIDSRRAQQPKLEADTRTITGAGGWTTTVVTRRAEGQRGLCVANVCGAGRCRSAVVAIVDAVAGDVTLDAGARAVANRIVRGDESTKRPSRERRLWVADASGAGRSCRALIAVIRAVAGGHAAHAGASAVTDPARAGRA